MDVHLFVWDNLKKMLYVMEKCLVVWWVLIFPIPEQRVRQGKKKNVWSDTPIIHSVHYCTSIWRQCYIMIWSYCIWSGLGSAKLCISQIKSADDLKILNHHLINGVFLRKGMVIFKLWKLDLGAWGIISKNQLATTLHVLIKAVKWNITCFWLSCFI